MSEKVWRHPIHGGPVVQFDQDISVRQIITIYLSDLLFHELKPALSTKALDAINSFGFKQATPVQSTTIPLFMSHKDVCVEAITGSGKTLAFGIPIFEILNRRDDQLKKNEVGSMVIAPTRELATQIYGVFTQIARYYTNLKCALFIGGTDVKDNCDIFEKSGAQIVIGTPGRVLDVLNRNTYLVLRELEVLVLDEADTLLDMGFTKTINQILSMLPKQRRTGLFSATQTQEVRELARAGMRNPVTVAVKVKHDASKVNKSNGQHSSQAIPTTLENKYLICKYEERPGHLATFLTDHANDKVIVFVSTCACVDFYSLAYSQLARNENDSCLIPPAMLVVGLHGKMAPKKRKGLYEKFTSSSSGVMFCTDVAARGIDIPDVDWIVQMSAPKDPSFFVHRIGRTARAGRKGGALMFISEEEQSYAEFLVGRGVPMIEITPTQEGDEMYERDQRIVSQIPLEVRRLCTLDRELLETSTTAFISFLRAYKEHLCSYIFRLDQLDIGSVARAYALVKLPKISETVNKNIDFEEMSDVNTSTIPYRHKEKEKARLKKQDLLKAQKEEEAQKARELAANPSTGKNSAAPVVEKVKKVAGKEVVKEEPREEKRKRKKKEGQHKKILDEWEELAAEEAMYKKMKRGHISREEYEDVFDTDTVLEFNDVASFGIKSNRMVNDGVSSDDSEVSSDEDDEPARKKGNSSNSNKLKKHLANRAIVKDNIAREVKKLAASGVVTPKVGPKKKKPAKEKWGSKKEDKKAKPTFTYGSKSGNKSFKRKFNGNK